MTRCEPSIAAWPSSCPPKMWMKVASLAKNDVQRRLSPAFHAASSCFRMSWIDCSSEVIAAPSLAVLGQGDRWRFLAHNLSVVFLFNNRVALCQRNKRKSTEKQHPVATPKNRPPTRKQATCRKYCAVLTSAFSHFAKTSSRVATTPKVTNRTLSSP